MRSTIGSTRIRWRSSKIASKNSIRSSSARRIAPAHASNQPGWPANDIIMFSSVTAWSSSHAMWMSKKLELVSGDPGEQQAAPDDLVHPRHDALGAERQERGCPHRLGRWHWARYSRAKYRVYGA